jgi:bifunctional DNA-binding transcriptional regulator/antitoxin component of YhaV-PrlF toxin-antitoxin module
METVEIQIKGNALLMPWEVAERLGWKEGMELEVEERDQKFYLGPSKDMARRIADLACIYLLQHVGEGYHVKTPVWQCGKWRVEVSLFNQPETVGVLMFSWDGQLLAEESDSPAKLRGLSRED